MSNKQIWTSMILSFLALVLLIISGATCIVLTSPAGTGTFEIEGRFDAIVNGEEISINRISGSVNSKILDILLLLADLD